MSLDRLTDDGKLDCSIDILQTQIIIRIQRILDDGDHDSADKKLFIQMVLALRELAHFRENFPKLKDFAEHTDECSYSTELKILGRVVNEARPCTCGLSALLKRFEAEG